MVTSSVVVPFAHGPLSTTHCRVYTPTVNPESVAVGEFTSLRVAEPDTNTQVPVAGKVTALPASVVLFSGVQSC